MARITIASVAASLTDVARSVTTVIADLGTQRARIDALEARVRELECAHNRDVDTVHQRARAERTGFHDGVQYPLTDRAGRRYRVTEINGRTVKCFAPEC